ncbi:hypothetical protein BH10BDE1_BH10BDE1_05800 [soil metagenome]
MRILLTGGTGLIGSELGKRLVSRGDEIVLLVRDVRATEGRVPFPAKLFQWNHNETVPPMALDGVDAIINLAGEPLADGRWTDEKKKLILDTRVLGTRHLVEGVRLHCPQLKVFVQGSATGIFGDRKEEILNGDSKDGSGFLADVVRAWEAEALKLNQGLGAGQNPIRLPLVRTSMVLARHGGALEKMLPLFRANVAGRLGMKGEQWMSWIHINDIAKLFIHAVDSANANGVLEGAAPEPVTNHDFTEVLCRELGVFENFPVPAFALKALYGEMSTVILESARVIPTLTKKSGFKFEFETIEDALHEILEPLRDSTYEKFSEQWVPMAAADVWPYFSDAKNLEELTPGFLKFKVKSMSTPEIQEGTLIDYSLSLNGIPFGWRTRIEDWEPGKKFIDTQLSGPYALWHHTHDFVPMAGGTLLRDRVRYRVPFGWVGAMASGWKVHKDVATIFNFRRKKIAERFGS